MKKYQKLLTSGHYEIFGVGPVKNTMYKDEQYMHERYIDEKNIDEEPSQEASVRIWAGADPVFRGEDKWRSCRGEEGGGEETARPKKGLFVPLENRDSRF